MSIPRHEQRRPPVALNGGGHPENIQSAKEEPGERATSTTVSDADLTPSGRRTSIWFASSPPPFHAHSVRSIPQVRPPSAPHVPSPMLGSPSSPKNDTTASSALIASPAAPLSTPSTPLKSTLVQATKPTGRGWRFWAVFIPMCVGTLLAAFEATVTSTALPTIVSDLGSGDLYVWILNGYLLTSAVSGSATSTTMLIAGRIIQGIGGGGLSVMTPLIISDLVSVRDRGRFSGIVFAVLGLGTAIGPVIGGVIVQNTTWRWVFYINIPVGLATLILQFFFLQVTYKKVATFKAKMQMIDWIGNLLLVTSVVSILIALSWANTRYAWSSWRVLVPLLLGFAGTFLFLTFEASKYCRQPIIPPRLFTNRTCAAAQILTFTQSMLTYWRLYFLPVYFQAVLTVSSGRSGVLLLPTVTVTIPTAVAAGQLLTRFGRYKPIHVVGLALSTTATGLYILFNASTPLAEIVIFQVIAATGTGCLLSTLLPAAQADLPQALVAPITGTASFIRSYGSIWGIAIPSAIFNAQFERLRSRISDPAIRSQLGHGSGYAHATSTYMNTLPTGPVRDQVINVYSNSLKLVWQIALVFSALSFFLAFLEKEVSLRKTVQSDFGLRDRKQQDIEQGRATRHVEDGLAPHKSANEDVTSIKGLAPETMEKALNHSTHSNQSLQKPKTPITKRTRSIRSRPRTSFPIRDPYIWHTDSMITIWEFHDFRGRVPEQTCEELWGEILFRARIRVDGHTGDSRVMQWRPWRREIKISEQRRQGEWFDLLLQPRWALTWRMLSEIVAPDQHDPEDIDMTKGIPIVCGQGKEFYFNIFAKGKLVGNGWTARRRDGVS
ncbi:MAG: hypothetical protein Q9218_003795 [Villophora microphyllina]